MVDLSGNDRESRFFSRLYSRCIPKITTVAQLIEAAGSNARVAVDGVSTTTIGAVGGGL
jgi:hypothetical protein